MKYKFYDKKLRKEFNKSSILSFERMEVEDKACALEKSIEKNFVYCKSIEN